MALQDDIFDIRDALKGKPEAKSFNRVEEALNRYEQAFHREHKYVADIHAGLAALVAIMKG